MAQVTGRKKIPLFNLTNSEEIGDGSGQPRDLWSEGPEREWEDPTFEMVCRIEEVWKRRKVAWDTLTDKQKFVLKASWGVIDGYEHSFREIADLMGVSHQAVHRIYGRGMETLRRIVPDDMPVDS